MNNPWPETEMISELREQQAEIERLRVALCKTRAQLLKWCDGHDLMTDDDAEAIKLADTVLED